MFLLSWSWSQNIQLTNSIINNYWSLFAMKKFNNETDHTALSSYLITEETPIGTFPEIKNTTCWNEHENAN